MPPYEVDCISTIGSGNGRYNRGVGPADLPDWQRLLAAERHLQALVPGTALVGATAAAPHARHRKSFDGVMFSRTCARDSRPCSLRSKPPLGGRTRACSGPSRFSARSTAS